MERKILAVVVAMITAVAIIWITYMIGTATAPSTPANLEYAKGADVAAYAGTLPTITYVVVAIGYALAGFAGGFIVSKMGRRWSPGMTLAVVVGILLSIGSLLTMAVWPQPIWFVAASILIFTPTSLIGYRLADHATSVAA